MRGKVRLSMNGRMRIGKVERGLPFKIDSIMIENAARCSNYLRDGIGKIELSRRAGITLDQGSFTCLLSHHQHTRSGERRLFGSCRNKEQIERSLQSRLVRKVHHSGIVKKGCIQCDKRMLCRGRILRQMALQKLRLCLQRGS